MIDIHDTAVIDPMAELGAGVTVGPYAVVGPRVNIGDGTQICHHAAVERDTSIGSDCLVGAGSIIGGDPQDLKYRSEDTGVVIGAGTRIREYTTINRGTAASGTTRVGAGCYLMSYVHVAHDCVIEDEAVIANSVQLGGHVTVERNAVIGGLTPVHQFVRIGQYAFVGGGSRVAMDVPCFCKAAGNPLRLVGLNSLGLERAGFGAEVRASLKTAYRAIFNSNLSLGDALDRLREHEVPEVQRLVDFLKASERGIIR